MPPHVMLIVVVIVVGVLIPSARGAAAAASAAFFPSIKLPSFEIASPKGGGGAAARQLEDRLLEVIGSKDGARLSNSDEIESLVSQLESTPGGGTPRPAVAPQVMGRWRLLHTSNADSASPIQRKAVDASRYRIYQDILCRPASDDDEDGDSTGSGPTLVVSQVVEFGDDARLVVDALASTSAYPIAELTERAGTGRILGLNVLGVSLVGEEAGPDPDRPDSRIDFVFDEGNFEFGKFKVPYPVPFRWPIFRDAVKGWIDITYLSDRIRISRGNKGTTFVLLKEEDRE